MVTDYKCYLPILSVGSFDGSTWHSKCTVSPSLHSTLLRWVINTGDSYTGSDSSVCPPFGASRPSMIGRASGRKEPPSNQWRSEKEQFSVSYRIMNLCNWKKNYTQKPSNDNKYNRTVQHFYAIKKMFNYENQLTNSVRNQLNKKLTDQPSTWPTDLVPDWPT